MFLSQRRRRSFLSNIDFTTRRSSVVFYSPFILTLIRETSVEEFIHEGPFEMCHRHHLSSPVCFAKKKLVDDLAAGPADTECVNLQLKPNRQLLRAPVTFPGTMHTVYHFVNKLTMAAIPPLWRMRPLTIAITPLLVRLPSICVASKRPYQRCWCRSRKCTPLLPISQDAGSSIRKHVPNYTRLYYSLFWAAAGMRTFSSGKAARRHHLTIIGGTGVWSPVWGRSLKTDAAPKHQCLK